MSGYRKQPVDFKLYMITDGSLCTAERFDLIVNEAIQSGVKAIQLREKNLNALSLLNLARRIKSMCAPKQTKLFINDRIDVAMAVPADGVHLTTQSLPAEQTRKILGSKFQVGVSTHSSEEVLQAEKNGCDFALFGPVFETDSKRKYGPPQGLKKLEAVCKTSHIPVFAVGGIDACNARECITAGAYGVAVISAIMKSENIAATLENFGKSLGTL